MNIKLELLLKRANLNDYKLLTEESTLNQIVNDITIMDTLNISEWIQPNQLLIIGSFFAEDAITEDLISTFSEKSCSGIITKNKFQKYISEDLINYSNKLNIPIIVYPDHLSWTKIMRPIYREIIDIQMEKIQLVEKHNYIMVNSVFKNEYFKGICDEVIQLFQLPIAIINNEFDILDASSNLDWNSIVKSLSTTDVSNIFLGEQFNSIKISIYHLDSKEYGSYELLSYKLDEPTTLFTEFLVYVPTDYDITNVNFHLKIENFLQMLTLKEKLHKKSLNDFLWSEEVLINKMLNISRNPKKYKYDLEISTGKTIQDEYYILIIKNDKLLTKDFCLKQFIDNKEITKPYFKEFMIFRKNDLFIGFLPHNRSGSSVPVDDKISIIIKRLEDFYNISGFLVGVSHFQNIEKLQQGFSEASKAIETTTEKNPIRYYDSLGFLRLLTDKKGVFKNEYYYELINYFIQPLVNYDQENNSSLLLTVMTYFENSQAMQSTAESLFIHTNTLRARLQRIYRVLEINPEEPDDILSLHLALKIYQSTKQ